MNRWAALLIFVLNGCGSKTEGTVTLPPESRNGAVRRDEAPIPTNGDPPITYPAALAAQRVGGSVILRMFVDSTGRVMAESTAVQESSGYPALDSAALASASRLHYAPALRNGSPVAAAFLQPVNFRPPPGGTAVP